MGLLCREACLPSPHRPRLQAQKTAVRIYMHTRLVFLFCEFLWVTFLQKSQTEPTPQGIETPDLDTSRSTVELAELAHQGEPVVRTYHQWHDKNHQVESNQLLH